MDKTTTVTRSALVWGGVVGLALLSIALVRWGERLPAPLPADAPLPSFSAGRALQALDGLTALGERVAGSESARRGADLLERTLRTLPGVEVDAGPSEQGRWAASARSGPTFADGDGVAAAGGA